MFSLKALGRVISKIRTPGGLHSSLPLFPPLANWALIYRSQQKEMHALCDITSDTKAQSQETNFELMKYCEGF